MLIASKMSDAIALIEATAWPVITLAIAGLFRKPLVELLSRDEVQVTGPAGVGISAKGKAAAADALVKASTGKGGEALDQEVAAMGVETAALDVESFGRSPQVLWVDDRPSNNRHEAAALSALGMHVELSVSTEDALARLVRHGRYDVIISDMGRPPDDQAGYTLLSELRSRGDQTPFVIYASSRSPEHFDLAVQRGAVGCTNRPDELIELVSNALRGRAGA